MIVLGVIITILATASAAMCVVAIAVTVKARHVQVERHLERVLALLAQANDALEHATAARIASDAALASLVERVNAALAAFESDLDRNILLAALQQWAGHTSVSGFH